jgi:hypothetical protein
MSTFSIDFLDQKVKIYKMKFSIKSVNIMSEIWIKDEITVYKYVGKDDDLFEKHAISTDHQEYNIINIYEDCPGITHVGIVYYISRLFYKSDIPLLYINTFSFNLILVSDEYIEKAKEILRNDPCFLITPLD